MHKTLTFTFQEIIIHVELYKKEHVQSDAN